jgi:hypothetical protein
MPMKVANTDSARHPRWVSRYAVGQVFDRDAIHQSARLEGLPPGNRTAGIVVIGGELCVFWNPYRKLYANRWIDEPNEFVYSGEGSHGPMEFTAGNRRMLSAEEDSSDVTVFYKMKPTGSEWMCLGDYAVVAHESGVSRDDSGRIRPDLRFRLARSSQVSIKRAIPIVPVVPPEPPTEDELWRAVLASHAKHGTGRRKATRTNTDKRQSDPLKTAYVIERAIRHGGSCESCGVEPSWLGDDGRPHFQAHHIVADFDAVDWIGAVCGTCHDRLHHGRDRKERAKDLLATVRARQEALGRPTFNGTR